MTSNLHTKDLNLQLKISGTNHERQAIFRTIFSVKSVKLLQCRYVRNFKILQITILCSTNIYCCTVFDWLMLMLDDL